MHVVDALGARDGIATFGELLADGVHPTALARAIESGAVEKPHRGIYALPRSIAAFASAKRLGGAVSHLSAAAFHGFDALETATVHHVTVPRARRKEKLKGVKVYRRDLGRGEELATWPVTSPERTCLDCMRDLSLREAVVVADSALHMGRVTTSGLETGAAKMRGNGSRAARTAVRLLDPKAESPLESVARVEMRLAGLPAPETQVVIATPTGPQRLDFYFRFANVGVETDGFATHGRRAGLLADCERHNAYLLSGVLVLRFGFEHVMGMPAFFTSAVAMALEVGALREVPQCAQCGGLELGTAA